MLDKLEGSDAPPGTRPSSSSTAPPRSTRGSSGWGRCCTSSRRPCARADGTRSCAPPSPRRPTCARATSIRAYLAGAGVNAVVPARGGDVVKLALVRRRIEGARYSTLAATFIPETLFETAFGTALVAWGLAMGFIPVPTTSGELPALDVSLVLRHPPSRPRSSPWRWSCSRPSGAGSCGRCAAPCAKGRRSSPRRGASSSASRAGRRSRASSGSAPSRPSWPPSACR